MLSKIVALKDVAIATTSKAVYIDGRDITLHDLIISDELITKIPRVPPDILARVRTITGGATTSLHSMVICDNQLITLECFDANFNGKCAVYEMPSFKFIKNFYIKLLPKTPEGVEIPLRVVASDYNEDNECLVMGSSTGGADLGMYGYIFYDFKNWQNTPQGEYVTFDNTPTTTLDFTKDFGTQSGAKIIWGDTPDTIFLTTNGMEYVHKILLGVGTNQLEKGTYDYDENKRYNGTFKIVETFKQFLPQYNNKDVIFHKGELIYPIKKLNGLNITKAKLSDGKILAYANYVYNPLKQDLSPSIEGSTEGIVVYNDKIIIGHANYKNFYEFDL